MKTYQKSFDGNDELVFSSIDFEPDLLLIFTDIKNPNPNTFINLRKTYPKAIMLGCSTAGQIAGTSVESDSSIVITAVKFDKTKLVYRATEINSSEMSKNAGLLLAGQFPKDDLRHLFILSDGLKINGSDLVEGLREGLPQGIAVTGGLAADGPDFKNTYIITNEGEIRDEIITAIGFYGKNLKIGYGSMGGWNSFGIDRKVTRSEANILYEIDNKPALELYKSFLGDQVGELPASALLFPLSMRVDADSKPLVRTILAVNEDDQSMTFAGNIPEGSFVRLMKANVDKLIDGAEEAAKLSKTQNESSELNILISCVGRRMVLKQIVEEEIEAVSDVLGSNGTYTGFYSYGEIAPFFKFESCELHNQTMTITALSER